MPFPFKSLREFLTHLEGQQDLVRVGCEVDPRWEIGYINRRLHLKGGPAVLYEQVKGHPGWLLADHILGAPRRCYAALNTTQGRVFDDYGERSDRLMPPKVVSDAPFQEIELTGEAVDLTQLPIPTWSGRDGGPYITCGVVMARDPENGYQNMAIYRMQLKGKNKTGILIHIPQHISYIHAKYEQRNQPMPLAVAIGVDPLTLLCCEASVPYTVSELELWGALAGQPYEVVPCRGNDLLVPAGAEIVLEGYVPPHTREAEGPFGEFLGYYSGVYNCNVFQVERQLMRKGAIYQGISVGRPPSDGGLIEGLMQCLESVKQLRKSIPQVRAMRILGTSTLQGVIAIDKASRYPGIARRVGNALWTSHCGRSFKNIFVVDDDVDIYSDHDIWWALATRFQGDTDIQTIPNTFGLLLDPSTRRIGGGEVKEVWDTLTCRTIFDCTQPFPPHDAGYRFGVVDHPQEIKERVQARWAEYGFRE